HQPPATLIYTLRVHDALPICIRLTDLKANQDALQTRLQIIAAQGVPNYFGLQRFGENGNNLLGALEYAQRNELPVQRSLRLRLLDRKSTRLNSSHVKISYAVF